MWPFRRRKRPPLEDALPRPSQWPSHAARAEARIARLMHAIRKYKGRDASHPKLAALRAELGLLTGLQSAEAGFRPATAGIKARGRHGAVVGVPAARLSLKAD